MTEGRLTVGLTDLKLHRENLDICLSVLKLLVLVCIKENLRDSPLPDQLLTAESGEAWHVAGIATL